MAKDVTESKEIPSADRARVHISVRNLVEFVLRSGDIDTRIGAHDTIEAMNEGSRVHRKLQGKQGALYHAEVPLVHIIHYDDYDLIIEGRADGIIYDPDMIGRFVPTIDEIKGTYLDIEALTEPINVHLAQAKCYAYMFSRAHDLPAIEVQMTYCNLDTDEVRRFNETIEFEELSRWFYGVIDLYKRWADFSFYWRITRQTSIGALRFPFEYRLGQKETAQDVYRTISRGKEIFIQAPTGSGKTLSTIYPSILAVGEGKAERIFYLTAKTITRVVARDTFSLFYEQGYRAKTVLITAKDKLCPLSKRECNPESCDRAKGHFDRINDAVYELLNKTDLFDRDSIEEWAKEKCVCPFELNLDISSWCDNIICDYNYVFDPNVYLKRFFGEGGGSESIFLIDEAHNLVERAREMYSASLKKESFLATKKYFKLYNGGIPKALDRCNKEMLSWKRECEDVYYPANIDRFLMALANLANAFERFFETKITLEHMDEIREFYFEIRNFIARESERDKKYRLYCDYDTLGEFAVHLYCVDPSSQLTLRLHKANASVFFSATLLPVNYYKRLLTTDPEPYAIYARTSFLPEKRLILLGNDVTTRYKDRGPKEYDGYARYISAITDGKCGNYMVFLPSYRMLSDIADIFEANYSRNDVEVIRQKNNMSENERDEFLASFADRGFKESKTLIAFCVLGGVFSEGIDLVGDKLIGAIIVGTGLPQVSIRRRILQEYFDDEGEGFRYAYLFPGMNKVAQAAGRVIRTSNDRGIIALLDVRFTYSEYKNTFPREWSDATRCTIENVADKVGDFWQSTKDMI